MYFYLILTMSCLHIKYIRSEKENDKLRFETCVWHSRRESFLIVFMVRYFIL